MMSSSGTSFVGWLILNYFWLFKSSIHGASMWSFHHGSFTNGVRRALPGLLMWLSFDGTGAGTWRQPPANSFVSLSVSGRSSSIPTLPRCRESPLWFHPPARSVHYKEHFSPRHPTLSMLLLDPGQSHTLCSRRTRGWQILSDLC